MTGNQDDRALLRRRRRARAESADYGVGYAKPPEDHQFKKGEPRASEAGKRGRKKSHLEQIAAIGDEKVTFVRNGRRVKITVDEAIRRRTAQDAMSGNARARADYLKERLRLNQTLIEAHQRIKASNEDALWVIEKIERMALVREKFERENNIEVQKPEPPDIPNLLKRIRKEP